jgi:hypothetical protein
MGLMPVGSGTASANIPAFQGGHAPSGAWNSPAYPEITPSPRAQPSGSDVLHVIPQPLTAGMPFHSPLQQKFHYVKQVSFCVRIVLQLLTI